MAAGGELFEAAAAPRPGQPERLLPTPVCKCAPYNEKFNPPPTIFT